MKYLICVFCGFAMFVACTATKTGDKTANINAKEWRLVSVVSENGLLTTGNVKKQTTLKIENDGKAAGQGGCNAFSGIAIINGTNIKFDKLVTTQMACFDMKIETAFFEALNNTDSYVLESENLKLKKGNTVIATFTAKN
jgi:heat shock protein HslJ